MKLYLIRKRESWRIGILLLSILISPLCVFSQSISNIERDGMWYELFDENDKQYKIVCTSECGELKGYSDKLIVFQKYGFYYIYDSCMKRQGLLSVSTTGDIASVTGETITTRKDSW